MKTAILLIVTFALSLCGFCQKGKEYYQITVYSFKTSAQEKTIDEFLKNSLIPDLHRQGTKNVGVFKPLTNDTSAEKRIYVLIPLKKFQDAVSIAPGFSKGTAAYVNAEYNNPPYTRLETILLQAFPMSPKMSLPKLSTPKEDHIYELRSYESATEALYRNKVKMFNEGGEVSLFARLGFNAIFYAEVMAGSRMPNLMYMTSFDNKAARDEHWKTFGQDPEWKKLSGMPEYQHNVSKADIILMKAASYSDY